MECKDVQKKLSDYLDGYVTTDEKEKIDEHMLGCDRCKADFHSMQIALAELRNLPELDPPADFYEQLMDKIADDKTTSINAKPRTKKYNWFLWATAAAVLLFVAVGAGIYGLNDGSLFGQLAVRDDSQVETSMDEDGRAAEEVPHEEMNRSMGVMDAQGDEYPEEAAEPESMVIRENDESLFTMMGDGDNELDVEINNFENADELLIGLKAEEIENAVDTIHEMAERYDYLDYKLESNEYETSLEIMLYSRFVTDFLNEVEKNYEILTVEEIYNDSEDMADEKTKVLLNITK